MCPFSSAMVSTHAQEELSLPKGGADGVALHQVHHGVRGAVASLELVVPSLFALGLRFAAQQVVLANAPVHHEVRPHSRTWPAEQR